MVIQSNMSSKAITEVWEDTVVIFQKYKVPITEKALAELVSDNLLKALLEELNNTIGSSHSTCIAGG